MRKFLSILMLACLLCGMVLPAAADGEETAQLYAKLNDGTWVDGLAITQNIPASFCFSTEENGTLITDGITSSDPRLVISKTDTEGVFSLTGSTLTASERFSLIYSDGTDTYAITVAVTPLFVPPVTSLEIPSADLGVLEGTDADFLAYLTGKGYSGSGDFTIILPAEDLGDITCNVQLPGNATLTLKGASGKKVAGLTIEADNICVDGVTFEGADGATFAGMTVKSAENCVISNCTFKNKSSEYAFHLVQDERVPWLVLNNNSFQGGCNVELVDGSGTLIGAWQSTSYDKTKPVVIDFGATPDRSGSDGITVQFPGDMKALAQDGWKFKWIFITADGYDKAFVVYDGENIDSSTGVTNNKNKVSFEVANGGLYTVVKGTLPELVKKDASTKELKFTEAQAKYLNKFTTTCDFKAVKITDKNGKAVKWEKSSDGKLTIWLTGSSPYTIKDDTNVTTKTTTKTTTTSRSYKYTYQDYYLITPQRVTDCMRYAKDNLVTIECKEAGRRSISLPVASMAAAAEKGYSILLKNEKIADITMDAAALKSMAQQAKGTTVLLHYRSLNHKTLTTVGQASIQSHLNQFPNDNADLAFLVTATSDSETIEDLQQGTITLKIPFIVLPGTEDKENVVYALQGETSADARETTVAEGYLTTKLTDLTEHMVFQIGESVETTEETTEPTVETTVETTQPETEPETVPETTLAPEPEKEEKGFPVWIPIVAVLLLAGGGAAAWFLYFRKRFKK